MSASGNNKPDTLSLFTASTNALRSGLLIMHGQNPGISLIKSSRIQLQKDRFMIIRYRLNVLWRKKYSIPC